MTLPTVDDRSSAQVERLHSRERAVDRAFRGIVMAGVGWAGLMAVDVADLIFGVGQGAQEIGSIAARALVWLGILVAASAGTHLLRFGERRGVVAFASFAAAGACGLVAVAEQFEAWFLETRLLEGLDVWALAGVILFVFVGALLLRNEEEEGGPDGRGEA